MVQFKRDNYATNRNLKTIEAIKENKEMKYINKKKSIVEIIICFSLMLFLTVFVNIFGKDFGLWLGILTYWLPSIILILYILKVEKEPLSSIGLKRICFKNIFEGLGLGFVMFIAQQIPLLIMGIDYSVFSMKPDFFYILITTFYCFFCVGFAEELIFRGFLFKKTLDICRIKWISIVINIILFYVIHWTSLPHNFGGIYNIAINTLILCIYYLLRTEKTLIPLMVGHGFYDTLTSVILPIFIYMNN